MENKPNLGFWKLWNLSFGFFGVQIAYALQSSQVSRIFSTIGADPHDLSYFWILPPLMGMIVQPIVGAASDNTWTRWGRRLPYLIVGALVAIIVMCFLPNAGSLGLSVSSAIIFGLIMLMFLDTSINMAMQPFKMLVGDFVNEEQKAKAYSMQSFLCNAGALVGYIAPIVLALFLSNTAPQGEVPPTVTWAFYIGAIILALCVIYTMVKVKEMPPAEYARYQSATADGKKEKTNIIKLVVKAPKVFWTVGLVQFFCWAAFLYMWTYSTDAIALHSFNTPAEQQITGVTIDGKAYNDKFIFNKERPVIKNGQLAIAGFYVDGDFAEPRTVVLDGDTIIKNKEIVRDSNGVPKAVMKEKGNTVIGRIGQTVQIDGYEPFRITKSFEAVSELSLIEPGTVLTLAHIAKDNDNTGRYELEQTSSLPQVNSPEEISLNYTTVLNAASKQYQDAGDWNGVLLAIQSVVAVLWAIVLAGSRRRKLAYSLSLLIGAIGFGSVYFIHSPALLSVSYGLMGCAWAAMLAMPFTILTNALAGDHIGTYLGLFNCTITIPQIVAALCGGLVLHCFAPAANGVPNTVMMLMVSAFLLLLGSFAVWNVKETFGSQTTVKAPVAEEITDI